MRDRCVRHRATPHGRHHAQRVLCLVVEAALRTKYTFLPCACRTRIVILRMLSRTRQMCCATNSSHLHRTVMRLCAGVTISCSRFHRSWSTIIDDYGHGMIGARLSSSTFVTLCVCFRAHTPTPPRAPPCLGARGTRLMARSANAWHTTPSTLLLLLAHASPTAAWSPGASALRCGSRAWMDFLPEMTPEHAPEQQSRSAAARARQRGARSERVRAQRTGSASASVEQARNREISSYVCVMCRVEFFFCERSSGKKE